MRLEDSDYIQRKVSNDKDDPKENPERQGHVFSHVETNVNVLLN